MARLAVILNAHGLICVRAALLGTGNRILVAFSLAGGRHTHLRQASGSPILIQGLWLRPDCGCGRGLELERPRPTALCTAPRFACTCTWAEVSANVSSREAIGDTSLCG